MVRTCYMNSTVQCLSATYPFSQLFLGQLSQPWDEDLSWQSDGSYKKAINMHNKLGTKGNLANAWSELLKALWREDYTFLSPVTFRVRPPPPIISEWSWQVDINREIRIPILGNKRTTRFPRIPLVRPRRFTWRFESSPYPSCACWDDSWAGSCFGDFTARGGFWEGMGDL